MTEHRRVAGDPSPLDEATGSIELDALRAMDVPLIEFVGVGGFLGFSPSQMFPERVA